MFHTIRYDGLRAKSFSNTLFTATLLRMAAALASSRRVTLLGVPIDALTHEDVIMRLQSFLHGSVQYHVMTPNSEMLVTAWKDRQFHDLLQRSALNLPDSHGLIWMAKLTRQYLPERVTGVDAMQSLCRVLGADDSVFLLGAREGVAHAAAKELQRHNPSLVIAGTFAGSPDERDAEHIVRVIAKAKPTVLFVAYGAPVQDLWIDRYLPELPSVCIAMGVGGSFDFIAGRVPRAPNLFRRIHLEWLWRLIQEPWRWKRIWTAVVIFPYLVLRYGRRSP
jgi:N-acetylglucosaminyldiphosphoundecaprenol N-acetyl-beta-D-mannosaminyltransferase